MASLQRSHSNAMMYVKGWKECVGGGVEDAKPLKSHCVIYQSRITDYGDDEADVSPYIMSQHHPLFNINAYIYFVNNSNIVGMLAIDFGCDILVHRDCKNTKASNTRI